MNSSKHRWNFFRAGSFDQVRLDSGDDIIYLDQLDQKLWVTLSCPTHGLEFNARMLEIIDADGDGRIRVPEILAATQWSASLLKSPDDLVKGLTELPLSAINADIPEGKNLINSAAEILTSLGKPDAQVITAEDMANAEAIFAQELFNGDGIIPADTAEEPEIRQVILDIIDCLGSDTDRSGNPGVSQEKVDCFFSDIQSYIAWRTEYEANKDLMPLGNSTCDAAEALKTVQEKIDDYFARCRLAAFDERAIAALNRPEDVYASFADKTLSLETPEAGNFPLALIAAAKPLPLQEGLNPAWTKSISLFIDAVVKPLFGERTQLDEAEWRIICSKFAAYHEWQSRKAGASVEKLGMERISAIHSGQSRQAVNELIARDEALKSAFDNIAAVEKLVYYHRYLFRLLNNFVSFSDFYTRKNKAIFQAGTLYLDGRSCELCVCVTDVEKHAALATLSRTYIAYCECKRRGGSEKMFIAAVFTDGDSDFLMVGRNGVFYDHEGQDWDATIVKLIDHPISIRQAFWSPYKKIGKMIREQIAKRAAAREKESTEKAAAGIADTGQKLESGKPVASAPAATATPTAAPQQFDVGKFAGIFAAIGLAFGAIGTALASVVSGFLKLHWWQMPLVLIGVILIISGPSVILAWLKLRQRSLGPLLDANGWAVNARARINVAFGKSLTKIATLPDGSARSLVDPYADKKSPWPKVIILAILIILFFYIANLTGKLYD